jgi:hypothetical protein
MKKSAAKPASAPKSKPTASAKKAVASKLAVPTKKSVPLARKPAAKPKAVATPPPAVKPGKPAPVVTTITARIDIGFGNALHVRGEGPGLSWHKGVPLQCVSDDEWTITLPETARPVVFKFLVNDLTWSAGPDYLVAPGSALVLEPTFED